MTQINQDDTAVHQTALAFIEETKPGQPMPVTVVKRGDDDVVQVGAAGGPSGWRPKRMYDQPMACAADAFDWDDLETGDVLFRSQPETAVYMGERGHICIRQPDSLGDDDEVVVIDPENAIKLIDRLCALSGYYPRRPA